MRVTKDAERLGVDEGGGVRLPFDVADSLVAIQHVNNETGVSQPLDVLSAVVWKQGGLVFADCSQSAGKLPLPQADMIDISAHTFGGPSGVGALLIRDLTLIHPSGGQEQGYRAGTENVPAVMSMAVARDRKSVVEGKRGSGG